MPQNRRKLDPVFNDVVGQIGDIMNWELWEIGGSGPWGEGPLVGALVGHWLIFCAMRLISAVDCD